MPNNKTTVRKRIAYTTPVKSRGSFGNPTYLVTFTDGTSYYTMTNGGVAYCIRNYGPDVWLDVTLEIMRGHIVITNVAKAPASEPDPRDALISRYAGYLDSIYADRKADDATFSDLLASFASDWNAL